MQLIDFADPIKTSVSSRAELLRSATPARWRLIDAMLTDLERTQVRALSRPGSDSKYLKYYDAKSFASSKVEFSLLIDVDFFARRNGFIRYSRKEFFAPTIVGKWSNHRMTGVSGVRYDEATSKVYFCEESYTDLKFLPGTYIVGSHTGYSNYGHFTLDILPSLLPFLDLLQSGEMKLVTAPLFFDWQRTLLGLLGVPPSSVIEIFDEGVRLERVVFSHLLNGVGVRYPNLMTAKMFQWMSRASSVQAAGKRRIFLNRASKRFIPNMSELGGELQHRGFEILLPENSSIEEQIRTFAAAEMVVGIFGASFTNIGYCRPGTAIVELRPAASDDPFVMHLAAQMCLRHVSLCGDLVADLCEYGAIGDRPYMTKQVFDCDLAATLNSVDRLLDQGAA